MCVCLMVGLVMDCELQTSSIRPCDTSTELGDQSRLGDGKLNLQVDPEFTWCCLDLGPETWRVWVRGP